MATGSRGPLFGPVGRRGSATVLVVFLALGLAVVRAEAAVALLAPAVVGALSLALLVRFVTADDTDAEEARRIARWTAAAFVVHLVLGLVIAHSELLVRSLGPDAFTYDSLARDIVRHWTSDFPLPDVPSGKDGFYYLLAALYWLFGSHPAAGIAVNATLAAALVPLLTDTTRRLFSPRAARYAGALALLTPGILLWTSQLLKEAPVLFLLALAANCAVRLSERISVGAATVLAGVTALLFTFRGWVGVMAAGGVIIGLVFGRRQLLSGLGTGVTAAAMISLLVVVTGLGYSGYQTAVGSDLQEASVVRRDLATSASTGFHADADISTPARALSYLPRGLVTLLLGPFPWQMRGGRQLLVLPDVVAWWALLPSLVRGLWAGARRRGRQILVLLMPALTTCVLLALAIGNFGTLVRERMQVFVLLVPFLCLGLSIRSQPADGDGGDLEADWAHARR